MHPEQCVPPEGFISYLTNQMLIEVFILHPHRNTTYEIKILQVLHCTLKFDN